jgi:hypothetical protein
MLGEPEDGTLLHIELQSTNQAGIAVSMPEYALWHAWALPKPSGI